MRQRIADLRPKAVNFLIVFVAAILGLSLVIIGLIFLFPLPASITTAEIGPRSVCNGGDMIVDADLDVIRAPLVVTLVQSWWSVTRERTEAFDTSTLRAVYTDKGRTKIVVYIPVPHLEPGDYEYRMAARSDGNSQTSAVAIPVTVKQCP